MFAVGHFELFHRNFCILNLSFCSLYSVFFEAGIDSLSAPPPPPPPPPPPRVVEVMYIIQEIHRRPLMLEMQLEIMEWYEMISFDAGLGGLVIQLTLHLLQVTLGIVLARVVPIDVSISTCV